MVFVKDHQIALTSELKKRTRHQSGGSTGSGFWDSAWLGSQDYILDVDLTKFQKPPCKYEWPKCVNCVLPIYDVPIRHYHKNYHVDCFSCTKCKILLPTNNFFEKTANIYCEICYYDLFAPKCSVCFSPIKDQSNMRKELGRIFHAEHFRCNTCNKVLQGSYRVRDNQILCEEDFHLLYSPKCASCNKPIRDDPLIAMRKTWHKSLCFRCEHCFKVLREDNYIPVDGRAYCKLDWLNLFAPRCRGCSGAIAEALNGDSIFASNAHWHTKCFRCFDCFITLQEDNFHAFKGNIFCQEHYHARSCPDCIEIKRAVEKNREKILPRRSISAMSRRSISPMDLILRPKSSLL